MPNNLSESLYPDIKQHGSLGRLLRAEFMRINSLLTATGFDESMGGSIYWANVQTNRRSSDISCALYERRFSAPLWLKGVRLAVLSTTSSDVLARTLHAWFIEQHTSQELKVAFPDVTVSPEAPSYEAGPQAYVEFLWAELLRTTSEYLPRLYPVVQLAYEAPAFRQLLPFTSMDILGFSRCTGYPFTHDCPTVQPIGENVFRVIGPSQEWLGEGNAMTAVKIALVHLPGDYGRAVHGTSEDLGRA